LVAVAQIPYPEADQIASAQLAVDAKVDERQSRTRPSKTGRIGQIAELPTLRGAHALGISWACADSLEVRSSFVGCARTDPYSMPA